MSVILLPTHIALVLEQKCLKAIGIVIVADQVLLSSHSQRQTLTPDRTPGADVSGRPSTYENMAEIDLNRTIPETPISQQNGFLSSRYSGEGSQDPSPGSRIRVSAVPGRRRRRRRSCSAKLVV